MRQGVKAGALGPASSMALVLGLIFAPWAAQAQTAPADNCTPRALRWQENCSTLADIERRGLQRLRYHPLTDSGDVWLTLGGEAKSRIQEIRDNDFGIDGAPGYLSASGRVLVHGDVRSASGARAFVQLGAAREDGRKPGSRSHEWSDPDVTQAFVDLPLDAGPVNFVARLGRQELELFGNRLLLPRDGASLPRTFEGARVDAVADNSVVLTVISVRPMSLRRPAFADRPDEDQRFSAVSLHVPNGLAGGSVSLFGFDRERDDAEYLRASGAEHRRSVGARFLRARNGWVMEAQGTWQYGRVAGLPVRAYGAHLALDRALSGPHLSELGFDVIVTSGDKASTRAIETFDPIYPNNAGLAAPLLYQANYLYGGVALSGRWAGATWTGALQGVARHSSEDAVYADGAPIDADFDRKRPTAMLTQLNVRRRFGSSFEVYGRVAHVHALSGITGVGGRDAVYWRVDMTARF